MDAKVNNTELVDYIWNLSNADFLDFFEKLSDKAYNIDLDKNDGIHVFTNKLEDTLNYAKYSL